MGWAGERKTTDIDKKTPQVLLRGPEALQLPSMAESSVLSLSPRTLLAIQKHLYKLRAPT